MTSERELHSPLQRFGKWSGTWLGTIAWFADQQIMSMTVYANCPPRTHALAVGVGAACALLALIGGLHSWSVYRSLPAGEVASASRRTDRFIAALSLLLACISILAIIFGTTAGVILRCER
ncbi:MAG TPA: hypothetical protein VJT80_05260 [Steroidobacteraceae bacterium]|nr:hypothetical protein [Steroidobacteraceae bacterium]